MFVYTSCLFATIVVHAFYAQHALYHHIFLCVALCSVMRYLSDNRHIHIIDNSIAHLAFVSVCCDRTPYHMPWLLVFPAAVALLWVTEKVFLPQHANVLHLALHLVTVIGLHFYLWAPTTVFLGSPTPTNKSSILLLL
jgi:hypothetical protein